MAERWRPVRLSNEVPRVRIVVEYPWDQGTGVSFDKIAGLPGAFRRDSSCSDETIKQKLKNIRRRIEPAGLPVLLEVSD